MPNNEKSRVMKDPDVFNSASEICEAFGWSIHTFYEYLELGLPSVKIRGQWRGHRVVMGDWYKGMILRRGKIDSQTSQ